MMNINEKRRNRNALLGIGFSLVVLTISAMYLQEQRLKNETAQVFQEKDIEILRLPEITHPIEVIQMPMLVNADQVINYYDSSKSDGELVHAVVEYQGVYRPSQSVCYSLDGKVFEVVAMVSGTVKNVYTDELMGKCVEVDVGEGLVITYQSLSNVAVIKGEKVTQTQVLGLAGENSYHATLGIHAQITAHKNGVLIDPESLISKQVSEVK